MGRHPHDDGMSVAELLVAVTVLLIVLGLTYYGVQAIQVSGKVTERQAQFATEISTPLHEMDKILSQNKVIENSGTRLSDGYKITVRQPTAPGTSNFERHVFQATTDGKLVHTVERQNLLSGAVTPLRTRIMSTRNANRTQGELFRYVAGASGTPTTPVGADSVIVTIFTVNEGQYFSGERRIFFRNR